MPKLITSFAGEYEFLSNFAPCNIHFAGMNFTTTEAAFQAAKTNIFEERLAISLADTPGKAKRLGRRVTLRSDWEEEKDQIMLDILRLKFTKGSELARRLDRTGDAILIEGNHWHDRYWGVCLCEDHCAGANVLGQLLIQVRAENRGETPKPICYEPYSATIHACLATG